MYQKLCANCAMFLNKNFLMFQFVKLASSFSTFHTKLSNLTLKNCDKVEKCKKFKIILINPLSPMSAKWHL